MRTQIEETSKSALLALCVGNSPVAGEFPVQRASNAEIASIWWRYHIVLNFKLHDGKIRQHKMEFVYCEMSEMYAAFAMIYVLMWYLNTKSEFFAYHRLSICRGYIYYYSAHSTPITMITYRSDLHSGAYLTSKQLLASMRRRTVVHIL